MKIEQTDIDDKIEEQERAWYKIIMALKKDENEI
jgi:hypothetical protein